MQASSLYTMKGQNAIATVLPKMASPELLLVSIDDSFARLVNNVAVASPQWLVERRNNTSDAARALTRSGVRLVVFDDQAVAESERGWLLAQVRRQRPGVPLLYVANDHNHETEILARRGGASYYTSKPIHDQQWSYVLRSFMRLHA